MLRSALWSTVLIIGAGGLISTSAASQPGRVDPTFNPGRGPLSVLPGNGESVLVQPDGKILATGDSNAFNLEYAPAVLRFNSDGSLDSSFDASALGAPGSYYWEYGPKLLALQPNGQILLAGWFTNPDLSPRYLTRLNTDGSIDATFSPELRNGNSPASDLEASLVAGGKILIGGNFTSINGVPRTNLARLNADGSLDPTFNAGVAIQFSTSRSFVVQSTGKPVVVTNGSGDQVFRLNTDGSLDGTFATVRAPAGYSAGGLLVEPDDKVIWTAIWAGGFADCPPTIISRVTVDGTSDPAFSPFSNCGGAPALLQQDGKLIIFSWYGGTWRLNPDGSPDPSFHPIGFGSFAQQTDGRLMVAGYFGGEPYPAGIRRLFLDGSNDSSFDTGMGFVSIRAASIDQARLLPNGKIVVEGGFDYIDHTPRWLIAVLNGDGSVDPAFDTGYLIGSDSNSPFYTMAVQDDGKILIAFGHRLVRLGLDGVVDPTFHYNLPPFDYVLSLGIQPGGKILLSNSNGTVIGLEPDGSVDPTFHTDQTGWLDFIQPDGKIYIRGSNRVTRLLADGTLDSGFDPNPTSGFVPPSVLARQPNNMLLVARTVNSQDTNHFTRLRQDGSIDDAFTPAFSQTSLAAADPTGIYLRTPLGPVYDPGPLAIVRLFNDGSRDVNFTAEINSGGAITCLLVQSNGQLIVAGSFDHVNGTQRAGVARLNRAVPTKLGNISTRVRVSAEQRAEIGGFVISGNVPKRVIVRAIGPSLVSSGLNGSDLLANPYLELHDSTGAIIAQNDDWRDTQEAEIIASGLQPADDAESAIVWTCPPGGYTAVVQGRDGSDGIALVEIYDLDAASESKLANISTRGFVNMGSGVMIAGFILGDPEYSQIVARAIGPSLASSGIGEPLSDPMLTVHDQSGTVVASNDDWIESQQAALEAYGMGPANQRESALITALPPGPYTAIVRGANSESGVGLVEIYHVQ